MPVGTAEPENRKKRRKETGFMKQNIKSFFERRIAPVVLAAALLLGAAIVTAGIVIYAEYTKSTRAKRVIAAYDEAGMLFSSNYLLPVGNVVQNRRMIVVSSANDTPTRIVTICNYAQGVDTKTYERDIEYTLTARFVKINYTYVENVLVAQAVPATAADFAGDLSGATVTLTFSTGGAGATAEGTSSVTLSSSTLSQSFSGGLDKHAANSDTCQVVMSSNLIDNTAGLYLELSAETTSGAGLNALKGLFGASLKGVKEQVSWSGYFNEAGARDVSGAAAPSAFDGFNYVIEGSGAGSCTLSWNTAKLEISQIFLTEFSPSLTPHSILDDSNQDTGWKQVTFNVNSDEKSRFDLQFYLASSSVSFADWNAVKNCVTFVYAASSGS